MDTIFMKSENSRTSEPHILILKLTDRLDLRRGVKIIDQILVFITHGKTWKSHTITINLKYQHQHGIKNKFELPDGSYSISNIRDYFESILKKHGENIDKPSVHVYVNKIENRVIFKIKDGYSLELFTPETMKLLGSTENKITKYKNGENVKS